MTKKQKLQLAITGLCTVGALATLFGGLDLAFFGLACFVAAGLLLILLLRTRD